MATAETVAINLNRIPVFPLPGTVLFPGLRVPLHVFEPRYRALVADAVRGDGILAIALLQPGYEDDYYASPEVHPVMGVGIIEKYEELDDGRYNILVRGLLRVEMTEELPTETYRCVRAEPLEDEYPQGGPAVLQDAANTLRSCCVKLLTDAEVPGAAKLIGHLQQIDDPALLTGVIASLFVKDVTDQQMLLQATNVKARIDDLTARLGEMLIELGNASNLEPSTH